MIHFGTQQKWACYFQYHNYKQLVMFLPSYKVARQAVRRHKFRFWSQTLVSVQALTENARANTRATPHIEFTFTEHTYVGFESYVLLCSRYNYAG